MCQYCFEGLGAAYLAADLKGESSPEAFDAPWTLPMLLQEGMRGVPPSTASPVTLRCLAIETSWRTGAAAEPRPFLPEGHRFGAWRAPRNLQAATPAQRTEAVALLYRYGTWAMEAARQHIWRGTPADAALLLDAFPALWSAWLMVQSAACDPDVVSLALTLATGAAVLTDEMVELWLQRRAVLVWCDAEGLGAVLDAYGTELRPFLAHYAALRRPPPPSDRERLTALAHRYNEALALTWSPA